MPTKQPLKKAPAKAGAKRSKKSGRSTPEITTNSGWFDPAMSELNGVYNLAIESTDKPHHGEITFATVWAGNWLLSYDAGHCDLRSLLIATKNGAAKVPPPWNRLILGVVAHKATLSTPTFLGEQRAKTVPAVVRMVGSLVQSFLFDDCDTQAMTVDNAVNSTIAFLEDRSLLDPLPKSSTVKAWHKEWREQETNAGNTVPSPKVGRPKK